MLQDQVFIFDGEQLRQCPMRQPGAHVADPAFRVHPVGIRILRVNRGHHIPAVADQVNELDPALEKIQDLFDMAHVTGGFFAIAGDGVGDAAAEDMPVDPVHPLRAPGRRRPCRSGVSFPVGEYPGLGGNGQDLGMGGQNRQQQAGAGTAASADQHRRIAKDLLRPAPAEKGQ